MSDDFRFYVRTKPTLIETFRAFRSGVGGLVPRALRRCNGRSSGSFCWRDSHLAAPTLAEAF